MLLLYSLKIRNHVYMLLYSQTHSSSILIISKILSTKVCESGADKRSSAMVQFCCRLRSSPFLPESKRIPSIILPYVCQIMNHPSCYTILVAAALDNLGVVVTLVSCQEIYISAVQVKLYFDVDTQSPIFGTFRDTGISAALLDPLL